jgi:radical SAM protein with 4Fe4S-binding SPASM domain
MSRDTARQCIDWVFAHVPEGLNSVEISFIGGEPLLEFELIKNIFEYVRNMKPDIPYIFFADTNGTLLDDEMKAWFTENKKYFGLGLSLDGAKETHDYNRSNSFDKIDIDFFRRTWPEQAVKMTLSDFSLRNLAHDIIYIHSIGFDSIGGVNLFEGNINWDNDEYIRLLVPQLKELVSFYIENQNKYNQMFDKDLHLCESKKERSKWCGAGEGTVFFDTNGKLFPCSFITPMTFPAHELDDISHTDFTNNELFIDEECFKNCYIYPVCPTCSGANYLLNKTFKSRNKNKCRIQKLFALFNADLQARLIQVDPNRYDKEKLYYTIEAIKKIRALYIN